MSTPETGVGSATVTSVIGPAVTATALVLTGVRSMNFNFVDEVVEFVCDQGTPKFDITADSTFTISVSGTTYTIVVS